MLRRQLLVPTDKHEGSAYFLRFCFIVCRRGIGKSDKMLSGVAVALDCDSNSQNWDMQVRSRESYSTVITQSAYCAVRR